MLFWQVVIAGIWKCLRSAGVLTRRSADWRTPLEVSAKALRPFTFLRVRTPAVRALVGLSLLVNTSAARASDILPPGFRPIPLGTHALVGAKIVVKPGTTLDEGVIIIRNGRIQQVGKGIMPPPEARIWDL